MNYGVTGTLGAGPFTVSDDLSSGYSNGLLTPVAGADNTGGFIIYAACFRIYMQMFDPDDNQVADYSVTSTSYGQGLAMPIYVPPGYYVTFNGDAECVYKVL